MGTAKDIAHFASAPVNEGVQELHLTHWSEFVELIKERHSNCPAYIYRGQANAEWQVESTLDRLEERFPKYRNYHGNRPLYFEYPPADRSTHLKAFREVVRGKRGPHAQALSEDEWWALAQHHGLATPMLDWTYYPFVALFFAFEEEYVVRQDGNRERPPKRAVFTLSSNLLSETKSDAESAPRAFSPSGDSSYRLASQGGLFVRMPDGKDLESWVRARFADETSSSQNLHARAVLQKVTVPDTDREDCLKFLNKMNINRMSLFPDLDGAAQYINALWELGFDTSLGRFFSNIG